MTIEKQKTHRIINQLIDFILIEFGRSELRIEGIYEGKNCVHQIIIIPVWQFAQIGNILLKSNNSVALGNRLFC